jgi:DNA polymerase-1
VRLAADTETNGFLDVVTVIHCLVTKDIDAGTIFRFHNDPSLPRDGTVEDGLRQLEAADLVVWHNGIKYDRPVIAKLHPWFAPRGREEDTLVLTRLIWPELKKRDLAQVKNGYPGKCVGKYSLEAWGHRLGNHKGDYKGGWETFNEDMLTYCVQDVELLCDLFQRCEKKNYSREAVDLEHDVARILALQETNGFAFNEAKAGKLYAELLLKQQELEAQLVATFQPWWVNLGPYTAKVNNRTIGYVKGVEFTKVEPREFNPKSLDDISNRLIALYGWKPVEFTDGGKPKVDEKVLKDLSYPPVPLLMEYLLVSKRIGQLAEGKEAWLKNCVAGRIHGAINPNGAVTGRMTHFKPNMGQVPKVGSAYGKECRELFEATAGWVLVGADASGLELRMLAHFMGKWDGGAYAKAVVEGKEEDGTDVHSINTVALGYEPQTVYVINGKQQKGRNCGKTFIYAFLYGAGDHKIYLITGKPGKKVKAGFLKGLPALGKLKEAVAEAVRQQKYLRGLDGRMLHVRSAHAALNTLLQSAGAIVMKKALVLLFNSLTARGWLHGRDYAFCANVHDEWQIETSKENADEIGRLAVQAIRDAGTHFRLRCALDGASKVGANWAETH